MSQLRAYKTGGTVHVVINNQVGFTTPPSEAHTSVYSTDVAKTIQAPIFHVNGDDPEAVVRVAEHAFAYRQEFKQGCRDRPRLLPPPRAQRGRRPLDDPAAHVQPHRGEAQRPHPLHRGARRPRRHHRGGVRGRAPGLPGAPRARLRRDPRRADRRDADRRRGLDHDDKGEQTAVADLDKPDAQQADAVAAKGEPESTAIDAGVVALIGDAHDNPPEGFTVHPKLQQLLKKRYEMSRNGQIDWGFGELLALGSLLLEGTPVRLGGSGCAARHLRLAARGLPRPPQRAGVAAARQPRREPGALLDLRLAAQRVRRARLRVRLLGRARRTRSCSGRRSSATSPTAPRPSSTSSSRAPSRSGASARASSCCCRTATRARGPTTRPRASSATCSSPPKTT